LTAAVADPTIGLPRSRAGPGSLWVPEKESQMSRRSFSFRAVIVSSIVGLALSLIPLATALAGGVGATFP